MASGSGGSGDYLSAQAPKSRDLTLVAIHGVGAVEPGSMSQDLSQILQQETGGGGFFERADLMIQGTSYPRLKASGAHLQGRWLREIIEVNWSDILRPADNLFEVLRHCFQILMGMRLLSVQPRRHQGKLREPYLAKLYWASIEWLLWWSAYLAAAVMLLSSCGPEQAVWRGLFALGAPLGALAMTWVLSRYSKGFRAGWLWTAIMAFASLSFFQSDPWVSRELWQSLSAKLYVAGQVMMGVLLIGAFLESQLDSISEELRVRASRGAFLWIPFIGVCAVGAGTWAGTLVFADQFLGKEQLGAWQARFLEDLRYDLLLAELGTLSAVAVTFVLIPLAGFLAYTFAPARRLFHLEEEPGQMARRVLCWVLRAGPLLLILGGLPFWYTLVHGRDPLNDWTVLEIYGLSASRASLVLPFLVPVLRVILDCAGDIVFHLQPPGAPWSSQTLTQDRLKNLLQTLREIRPQGEILLLAHSQGSVIAWELLQEEPGLSDQLVTAGSPLTALYRDFLGKELGTGLPEGGPIWRNVYRSGDYIGGEVKGCPYNRCLGPGGHTGYWSEPKLLPHLIPQRSGGSP